MTMKRNELRNALTLIALAFGAATLPAQATDPGSSGSSASGSASPAGDASSSGTSAAAAPAGTNSGGPSNNSAGRAAGTNMPPSAAAPRVPMSPVDQELAAKVSAAIMADDQLKDAQLTVHAANGEVTLSGRVKDQGQGDRAMEVVKKIAGVRNVTPSIVISTG